MSESEIKASSLDALVALMLSHIEEVTLEDTDAASDLGLVTAEENRVSDKVSILKLFKFFIRRWLENIDNQEITPYTDRMNQRIYTEDELNKAIADAEDRLIDELVARKSGMTLEEYLKKREALPEVKPLKNEPKKNHEWDTTTPEGQQAIHTKFQKRFKP